MKRYQDINLANTMFICSGNIFRSPFAEQYFTKQAKRLSLNYKSSSRGVGKIVYPNPHKLVIDAATNYGVNLAQHTPLKAEVSELTTSSAIFVMEEFHVMELKALLPDYYMSIVYFLGDFANQREIHDLKVERIFEEKGRIAETFDTIVKAVDKLFYLTNDI